MIPKFEKKLSLSYFVEHVETNPLFDQNSRLAIRLNFSVFGQNFENKF